MEKPYRCRYCQAAAVELCNLMGVPIDEPHGGLHTRVIVYDRHKCLSHSARIIVLDNVATVHNPGSTLPDQRLLCGLKLQRRGLDRPARQNGATRGSLNNQMIFRDIIARIGLDNVRAKFYGLANKRNDLSNVAIHHISPRIVVRAHDKRFHHKRHSKTLADRLEPTDIRDTLMMNFGLTRNLKQIYHNAGRIEAERLLHHIVDQMAE